MTPQGDDHIFTTVVPKYRVTLQNGNEEVWSLTEHLKNQVFFFCFPNINKKGKIDRKGHFPIAR
jgi:hypothetical protein